MTGGGRGEWVNCGGQLKIHNDIHNTDFCYIIECHIGSPAVL